MTRVQIPSCQIGGCDIVAVDVDYSMLPEHWGTLAIEESHRYCKITGTNSSFIHKIKIENVVWENLAIIFLVYAFLSCKPSSKSLSDISDGVEYNRFCPNGLSGYRRRGTRLLQSSQILVPPIIWKTGVFNFFAFFFKSGVKETKLKTERVSYASQEFRRSKFHVSKNNRNTERGKSIHSANLE